MTTTDDTTKIEACARAAHEVNRAYCLAMGDDIRWTARSRASLAGNEVSLLLDRWRAFIETQAEVVAERLDLLDRVSSSGWTMWGPDLFDTVRMLYRCRGTSNEVLWREKLLLWAEVTAEREATNEAMMLELRDRKIREELEWSRTLCEREPVRGVFAGRGGGSSDCDPSRIRLAIFSRDHHSEVYRADFGCRDLSPDEARAVAAQLVAEAAAVEGSS